MLVATLLLFVTLCSVNLNTSVLGKEYSFCDPDLCGGKRNTHIACNSKRVGWMKTSFVTFSKIHVLGIRKNLSERREHPSCCTVQKLLCCSSQCEEELCCIGITSWISSSKADGYYGKCKRGMLSAPVSNSLALMLIYRFRWWPI